MRVPADRAMSRPTSRFAARPSVRRLVLVDGLRLNDSQSGHHNGDMPVPTAAIDRIEVVAGAGSSVHGADALGGTINSSPDAIAHACRVVERGQHGFVAIQASTSGTCCPPAGR